MLLIGNESSRNAAHDCLLSYCSAADYLSWGLLSIPSSIADTIYLSFVPVLSNTIVTSQTQVDIEHLKWGYYK